VADHGNKRIHKYSALPAAEFISDRKVPGWQVADVFWPHLAIDSHDNVYAMDQGNRKIWIYDSELNYRGTIGGDQGQPPFAAPLGLAFAPGDALWVSDMANNRLLKLNPFSVPAPK
jgi:DNA-binding beta-propeller fold protein YncE